MLCEVGMPRLVAVDGGLDPADDYLLVCVQQRSFTVHLALQLSTVVAELRHQHLVGLSPQKVFCTGLRQAQGPEALVVGTEAFLGVSKGHVKVMLLVGDFSKSGLQSRMGGLTCCIMQWQHQCT